ncbi:MAG: DUF4368 domain-containing protein, partial [Defluviitaleaceae bacterium]|nr:DUF4368 domain-containing protein [Defluviitaleaceae bacterium]
ADVKLAEISNRLSALSQTAEQAQAKGHDIEKWIALIKEKSTLEEVDRGLLESLIEKIEVGKKQVINGVKTQDVKIHFKYYATN